MLHGVVLRLLGQCTNAMAWPDTYSKLSADPDLLQPWGSVLCQCPAPKTFPETRQLLVVLTLLSASLLVIQLIYQVCSTSYSRGQYNIKNGNGAYPILFPWWDVPGWTLNYTPSHVRWKRNFILGKCTCKSTTANMGSSEGVKENNHWASLLNGSYECTSSNFLKP